MGQLHAELGPGLVCPPRAKMPKGAHYIAAGRSMTPLTEKLNPTDTGVMRLQFRRDR